MVDYVAQITPCLGRKLQPIADQVGRSWRLKQYSNLVAYPTGPTED